MIERDDEYMLKVTMYVNLDAEYVEGHTPKEIKETLIELMVDMFEPSAAAAAHLIDYEIVDHLKDEAQAGRRSGR